jgi:hypothetical protein
VGNRLIVIETKLTQQTWALGIIIALLLGVLGKVLTLH